MTSYTVNQLPRSRSSWRISKSLAIAILVMSILLGNVLVSLCLADVYGGGGTYEDPYVVISEKGSGIFEFHRRGQTIVPLTAVTDPNGVRVTTYSLKQFSIDYTTVNGVIYDLQVQDNKSFKRMAEDTTDFNRVKQSSGNGHYIRQSQAINPLGQQVGNYKDKFIDNYSSTMNSASHDEYILQGDSDKTSNQYLGWGNTPFVMIDVLTFGASMDTTWDPMLPGFWEVTAGLVSDGVVKLDFSKDGFFDTNSDWDLDLGNQSYVGVFEFVLDYTNAGDFWQMFWNHWQYLPSLEEWDDLYISQYMPA